MPRPEKPTGLRTLRHWTSACFLGVTPGRLIWYDGSQLADAGRGDDGAVALTRRGELLLGAVLGLHERQRGRAPVTVATIRTLPPTSRAATYAAVEGQRADEAQSLRIGDVDLGERRTAPARYGIIRLAIAGSGSAQ